MALRLPGCRAWLQALWRLRRRRRRHRRYPPAHIGTRLEDREGEVDGGPAGHHEYVILTANSDTNTWIEYQLDSFCDNIVEIYIIILHLKKTALHLK